MAAATGQAAAAAAVAELEQRLEQTHGGVAQQSAFHLPSSCPPGVPKTCYDEVDPASYLGPAGQHREMVNADGLRLQTYFWPAAAPRAVMLFVHGHGAHTMFEVLKQTERLGTPMVYEGSWAQQWNAAGISVAGLDLQGCGRSEGKRGLRFFMERFEDYVADVLQLARELAGGALGLPGFEPSLPRFLGGISLGGCITFNAMLAQKAEARQLFKGAVLLAPMLSLEKVSRKGLNPYIRPLASLLSWLAPTAAIVATEKNTLYPAIQAMWDADPLTCHISTRVRNASEYLRIAEASMQRLEEADFPFIVFHSENDTMVDVDGSKALFLRAKSADKSLRLINEYWHIIVREPGNERINAAIAEWVLERV